MPELPPFANALSDGVWCIDTGYHRPHYDAAYLLVDDGRAAFWDTGTNFAVPSNWLYSVCISMIGIAATAFG